MIQGKNQMMRTAATAFVRRACAVGLLSAPPTCEACGAEEPLHAHHDDYAEPLAVTWVCRGCHHTIHNPDGGTHALKRDNDEEPSDPMQLVPVSSTLDSYLKQRLKMQAARMHITMHEAFAMALSDFLKGLAK